MLPWFFWPFVLLGLPRDEGIIIFRSRIMRNVHQVLLQSANCQFTFWETLWILKSYF
jgi:hypothetical protein